MLLITKSQELYCNFNVYFEDDDWIYTKRMCVGAVAPFLLSVISPLREHQI